MGYAEIILPLPIFSTFTYAVPDDMAGKVVPGSRVIVPFGRRKFYTGIVESLSFTAPSGYEVKEIAQLLDDTPIVRHPQLKFWHWVADYYLCAPGDVYKAAVPAGLKIESETFVELSPEFEENGEHRLSDREIMVCQLLNHDGRLSASDIEKKLGLKRVEATLSGLIDKGAVMISERLVERYRSKKVAYVRLKANPDDPQWVAHAFAAVHGAHKQETVLLALLELTGYGRPGCRELRETSRANLMERSGCSSAIIGALVAKGLVEIYHKEINRFRITDRHPLANPPELSEAQSTALHEIHRSFVEKATVLLHGVTSSGKTEIYIHLIDFVLREGKQVLYLVPEIALTTQLTGRLQRVFGDKVVIYHSKFSDNERVETWRDLLHDGSARIIIGARSAVFLPFSSLGLVIVDEEHEQSYKQFDPAPRYHARDAAMMLASMHGAKTLLGSATPAIDTYYKATTGRYGLVTLDSRFGDAAMPEIKITDMKRERQRHLTDGLLAAGTESMTKEAISRGEQVIMFHNRRGFAPLARCKVCAYVPKCDNCDVSLTYHRRLGKLVCHYCGATRELPAICPACGEPAIEVVGYGTERIEDQVEAKFPESRILRMDLDTTRNKDSYESIINNFSSGNADILIGTQMVTKGLDFGGVSLVAVLNADALINFPEFRAPERAFNMLMQVAGRAGRRSGQGTVIVQTYDPDHPIINYLLNHDYIGFYNHEIEERRRFCYPPFTRLIHIYLKHRDADTLAWVAENYGRRLRELFGTRVFGPDEPPVARIQNLYIRKLMLKIEIDASLKKVKTILRDLFEAMHERPEMKGVTIYYDVDPM